MWVKKKATKHNAGEWKSKGSISWWLDFDPYPSIDGMCSTSEKACIWDMAMG